MSNFYLKCHDFFAQRVGELKTHVKKLKDNLQKEEFILHETVKFAARVRKATFAIIPENPDRPDYLLHGELKKYRRYKQGLQRYRIMFCFANNPPIIIYLYLNDKDHLRKAGGKKDPYEEFKRILKKEKFSHDPQDPQMQKWIQKYVDE